MELATPNGWQPMFCSSILSSSASVNPIRMPFCRAWCIKPANANTNAEPVPPTPTNRIRPEY